MTAAPPAAGWYGEGAAAEPMLRTGPRDGPQVLVLQPLFAELNRCRRLLVDVMAALAARGVGSWMPDLPGTGESPRALGEVGWADWREAVTAAGAHVRATGGAAPFTLALRGGALLDGRVEARGRWRLAPIDGAAVLTSLVRARLAADREAGLGTTAADLRAALGARPVELAGHVLSPVLAAGLSEAVVEGEARTLGADDLSGEPLWLRAEPGRSPAFAEAVADDVARWIASCAAS